MWQLYSPSPCHMCGSFHCSSCELVQKLPPHFASCCAVITLLDVRWIFCSRFGGKRILLLIVDNTKKQPRTKRLLTQVHHPVCFLLHIQSCVYRNAAASAVTCFSGEKAPWIEWLLCLQRETIENKMWYCVVNKRINSSYTDTQTMMVLLFFASSFLIFIGQR